MPRYCPLNVTVLYVKVILVLVVLKVVSMLKVFHKFAAGTLGKHTSLMVASMVCPIKAVNRFVYIIRNWIRLSLGWAYCHDYGCMSATTKSSNLPPVRACIAGSDNRNFALNPERLILSNRFELLAKNPNLCPKTMLDCCLHHNMSTARTYRGLYVRLTKWFTLLGEKVLVKDSLKQIFLVAINTLVRIRLVR